MAELLADKDIKKLIGICIIGGTEECVKPNSYELRLGSKIRFKLTDEEFALKEGEWLELGTGESIDITSYEKIDFSAAAVQKVFEGSMLFGLINTRTTLMREGVTQVSTKIDAGFTGVLDWELRNNYYKSLPLQFKEKIFNLIIFKLKENEIPELPYGKRPEDFYQNSEGLLPSGRKIPAQISEKLIKRPTRDRVDHKKQLREAGPPVSYIGEELMQLDGKIEVVDKSVRVLKEKFEEQTKSLTKSLNEHFLKIENIFNKKFIGIYGFFLALVAITLGVIQIFRTTEVTPLTIYIPLAIGVLIGTITVIGVVSKKKKKGDL
jgi:deoxycytidine triphosphate deaminase